MSDKPDLQDVLAVVNRGRVVMGFQPLEELPRGKPGSRTLCPLALAFGCLVEKYFLTLPPSQRGLYDAMTATLAPEEPWSKYFTGPAHERMGDVKLPSILQSFTHYFDTSQYPELIAG